MYRNHSCTKFCKKKKKKKRVQNDIGKCYWSCIHVLDRSMKLRLELNTCYLYRIDEVSQTVILASDYGLASVFQLKFSAFFACVWGLNFNCNWALNY